MKSNILQDLMLSSYQHWRKNHAGGLGGRGAIDPPVIRLGGGGGGGQSPSDF